MAEIVAGALTAHAPLITGKPDVQKPEQRDRLYAGFHEVGRRLTAARPDLLVIAGGRMDHRLRHRLGAPMSTTSYALNKVLTGIARQHLLKSTLTDEEMAGHALSDAERTALRTGDIGQLYALGANPYLIRRVFRPRFAI